MSVPAAVFASGGGSNFQSLIDRQSVGRPGRILLLVTDRPEAGVLRRAEAAGGATRISAAKGRSLDEVGEETREVLGEFGIEVVLLAGYLRLIPPSVVRAFPRRILNIHPALLPAFGGKGM